MLTTCKHKIFTRVQIFQIYYETDVYHHHLSFNYILKEALKQFKITLKFSVTLPGEFKSIIQSILIVRISQGIITSVQNFFFIKKI